MNNNKSSKDNRRSSVPGEKKSSNPCIRCGKQRIDSKTWEEKITNFMGTSIITHTQTVCPDPECQKIVEKEQDVRKKRKEELEQNKEDRRIRFKKLHRTNITFSKASNSQNR